MLRSQAVGSAASIFRPNSAQHCSNPRSSHHLRPLVQPSQQPSGLKCRSNADDKASSSSSGTSSDVGVGLKSVWVGAEVLGNLVGAAKQTSGSNAPRTQSGTTSGSLTREEAIELIRKDYDVNYFVRSFNQIFNWLVACESDCISDLSLQVSGTGDLSAYAPDCRFADPFASFRGTDRFQRNVGNLGGMLRDIQLDISDWTETEDGNLRTKWRFSAILDLPWKPRLAAAGGTLHIFDPNTNLVIEHIESWDVEPSKVVGSLLKPSAKIPTNNWDVLFNSIYDRDLKGIWLASSGNVAKLCGGVLGLSVVLKVVTGEGLGVWPLCLLGLGSALVTEVLKISGGMQGGDTGTGGRF